jgi:hypothetical protein
MRDFRGSGFWDGTADGTADGGGHGGGGEGDGFDSGRRQEEAAVLDSTWGRFCYFRDKNNRIIVWGAFLFLEAL